MTLGGVVAGEGSFTTSRQGTYADGSERVRFVFQVTMASWDRPLLEALQQFLGRGSIDEQPGRRAGWQPTSTFRIQSRQGHHSATIPFADTYLVTSRKRDQYLEWREAFHANEQAHPSRYGRGPSTCSVVDCFDPVRGQGLCRKHYYRATGN